MAVSLKAIKLIAETPRETRPEACAYQDCSKKIEARGLCKAHYHYYQKYIRPNYPIVVGKPSGEPDYAAFVGDPCSMCGEPSQKVGFCKRHYDRYWSQKKRLERRALEDFLSTKERT